MGTSHYIVPEPVTSDPLDPRTDTYVMGITAFEMITSPLSFQANDTKELLGLHQTQDIPDPKRFVTDVPDELRQFI